MKKAWSLGWLVLCVWLCGSANGQIELRAPSPNDGASDVGQPTLFWSVAGANLLENGSFEDGTNGWILPPGNWRVGPRTSAYDGTNMLMLYGGKVARDVTLPQTTSAIMWTFGVRGSGTIPPNPSFTAEVQTPEGEVLQRSDFLRQGHESPYDNPRFWRGAVDLSAFAGRAVRLALVFTTSGAEVSVDDWRVEVFPEGVSFEVYMMENLTARLVKVATTQGGSFAVTNLWPGYSYLWRVDTIFNGQTNTGAVWSLKTRIAGRPQELEFGEFPSLVCPGREFPLNLFLRDTNGLVLSPSASSLSLIAAADNVPPTALITEVNVSTNAELEIANVSTNVLTLTNWRVQIYPGSDYNVRLPTNAVLGPGEMFTMRSQDFGGAWPHLGLGAVWNRTNTDAGVILRDARSNIVDCVFIDRSTTTNLGWGSIRVHATPIDWRSLALENVEQGLTYQRVGNSDSNTREDWIAAAPSIGRLNDQLTLPFSPGFGRAPATFGANYAIRKDMPTLVTSATFPISLSNVWLLASQPIPINAEGASYFNAVSQTFQVVDVGRCITIFADSVVLENAGRIPATVELGAPAEIDIIVSLTLSETADVRVPAEVRVPAGSTQASFEIELIDNNTLEGPRSFTITATAPEYAHTENAITIRDDERPTLSITAPELVREGEPAQLVITSSMAPVRPIQLQIDTAAPIAGSRELAAGANKLVLYVGGNDNFLQGNGRLKLTATALDWDAATAEFDYIDQTVGQLSIVMPQQIVEGGQQKMSLSMGAPPATQRQFRLTTSRPDLISVPEGTTIFPGVFETPIQFHALPANGSDRVEEVQIIASADGFDSVTNVIRVLIEEIDSGQIDSAGIADDGSTLRIRFTTRANWKYSLGQAATLHGSWNQNSQSIIGDGKINEFSIPRSYVASDYPNFFRIFREPPPL